MMSISRPARAGLRRGAKAHRQFTRSCAGSHGRDNIQANAILPGWIDTDLTRRARAEIEGPAHKFWGHAGGAWA